MDFSDWGLGLDGDFLLGVGEIKGIMEREMIWIL